jgi:3-hydroxyacyl-[acyl-carrier-protein] dehydratase
VVREHVDVRRILPQRYPLLLVDRVVALDPGRSIQTLKAVTATEPCYAGLPDDAPAGWYAYPESLLIESLGQSAALLWLHGRRAAVEAAVEADQVLLFVSARDYRFDGRAYPGDVLRHEVRLESVVADTAFASGETWVGDRRIAGVGTLIAARRTRGAIAGSDIGTCAAPLDAAPPDAPPDALPGARLAPPGAGPGSPGSGRYSGPYSGTDSGMDRKGLA